MELPLALVVEDDKNLALAFAEALSDAGYQTEVIYDGQTALERMAAVVPAMLVLDLHIPRVKGLDVLKRIRSDARFTGLRVIVATADDRTAEMVGSLANLVLLKPVGYQQLRDLSSRFLAKKL
jgi:DNA-binding response OmpR family regulator